MHFARLGEASAQTQSNISQICEIIEGDHFQDNPNREREANNYRSNSNSHKFHRNWRCTGRGSSYQPKGLTLSSSSNFPAPNSPESTTRPASQWPSRGGNSRIRANRSHQLNAPATRIRPICNRSIHTHPADPPEEPTPPTSSQSNTGEFASPLNNLYSGTANSCQTG